jgi:hypothetical protein
MTPEPKSPDSSEPESPNTTSTFPRPNWAPGPLTLPDPPPRVSTGELLRPKQE